MREQRESMREQGGSTSTKQASAGEQGGEALVSE